VQNFKTFLAPWSGQPSGAPAVKASAAGGRLTAAVSWNGATQVASWRLLAGASPAALAPVATSPKTGFQTTLAVTAAGPYVALQALDGSGQVIGTSATVKA
jgi:hypothetical protein